MKGRNLFWGVFFLLAAAAAIAFQLGTFETIDTWSIIVGVLLLALIVQSLFRRNFFGVFVPMAFLYMVFDKPLGFPEVNPYILVLAGVLASIGFSIIFGNRRKTENMNGCCGKSDDVNMETIDDNNPYAKVHFGSSTKYLHADSLKGGKFIASFGELQIFFDQVTLSPEGAEVYIDCNFAEIKLNIPSSWKVVDKIHVSLAEVKNNRRQSNYDENSPQLTLTGNVNFGGVQIN